MLLVEQLSDISARPLYLCLNKKRTLSSGSHLRAQPSPYFPFFATSFPFQQQPNSVSRHFGLGGFLGTPKTQNQWSGFITLSPVTLYTSEWVFIKVFRFQIEVIRGNDKCQKEDSNPQLLNCPSLSWWRNDVPSQWSLVRVLLTSHFILTNYFS